MNNHNQDTYINSRVKEFEQKEILDNQKLLEKEAEVVEKFIKRLKRTMTFEERIVNFDTSLLQEISYAMKWYVKRIDRLKDDTETIIALWNCLEKLASALFDELYRPDRDYISKWAILDEINDFFINMLDRTVKPVENVDEVDINSVGESVILMLRQIYRMHILKLYVDVRTREHIHDINELLMNDGIRYVAESEIEFYNKVEDSIMSLIIDNGTFKKLIDDIVEKIY